MATYKYKKETQGFSIEEDGRKQFFNSNCSCSVTAFGGIINVLVQGPHPYSIQNAVHLPAKYVVATSIVEVNGVSFDTAQANADTLLAEKLNNEVFYKANSSAGGSGDFTADEVATVKQIIQAYTA